MSERKVKKPILIIGAPRSGTTLLGRIFSAHPDVAFWEEPRTIWEIGNSFRETDVLTEGNLTPGIARKIDKRFGRFLEQSGKHRFAEKTPANTLRVQFIHALYPDAKIIHVVRDGKASVTSVLKMRARPPRFGRVWSRLRETPVSGYPGLLARAFQQKRFQLRPANWETFSDDPVENAVQQWMAIEAACRDDLRSLPENSWIEINYESFISNHQPHLRKMQEFCELPPSIEFSNTADKMIDPNRSDVTISAEVKAAFRKFENSDSTGSSR